MTWAPGKGPLKNSTPMPVRRETIFDTVGMCQVTVTWPTNFEAREAVTNCVTQSHVKDTYSASFDYEQRAAVVGNLERTECAFMEKP